MAALGDSVLAPDVVSGLTEEMDGALMEETSTRGRITAETSVFWHQRVRAVAHSACRNTKPSDESRSLKQQDSGLTPCLWN